jgi:hypothetical protein
MAYNKTMDLLEDYGQTHYLSIFQTQAQFILNLMGKSDYPTILTGEAMDQEEYLRVWAKTPNQREMVHIHLNRMFLAYLFDDLPPRRRWPRAMSSARVSACTVAGTLILF